MKLLLLALSFICLEQAIAQTITPASFKRFAFQAGININNLNFNRGVPAPEVHDPASWKTGVTLGFLLRVPIARNLFLQPEYAFTQKKGSDKSLGINYRFDYISLPVLLNYRLSPRFALVGGPQLELLADAKLEMQGVKTDITHDVEERSIALTGGLEIDLGQNFLLSIRYLQGLNHVGIGQRSDVKEFKYESLYFAAGIRF